MEKSSSFAVTDESRRVTVDEQEETISCRPSVDGSADSPDYSDAEDHSWHLPYTSNGRTYVEYDCSNASDPEIAGVSDLARHSVSDSSEVDLEKGPDELNAVGANARPDLGAHLDRTGSRSEKECRICHLALETTPEAGNSIVLGCACKDDLAAAHKQCAEAWFKIKGNKTCEICGSTARNVVGIENADFMDQWNEGTTTTPAPTEPRNFWRGHRFLNFLLACMVFAFVISWLFHFNIPS
eukprot:Gb_20192 [translate_table: standard]